MDTDSAPTPTIAPAVIPSTNPPISATNQPKGQRKNGKNWHENKKPFRPTAGLTSYVKRKEADARKQVTKALEREMKEEKEVERNQRVQAIKDRRKAKEEKERYERMAEKMHAKRVERRRKREKRNKLLKS